MIRTAYCVLMLFMAFGAAALAQSDDGNQLPDANEGYRWQALDEIKGAVQMPDGWFFRHDTEGTTEAYFVTKEEIEDGGIFSTGLSINVLHDIEGRTGVTVSKFAEMYVEQVRSRGELLDSWSNEQGPFTLYSITLTAATDDGANTAMNHLAIANTKTGTLYLFIFESPAEEWESAWEYGNTIMSTFQLDESI